MICHRPIAMTDAARPEGALPLAGGACWFEWVEVLERGRQPERLPARDLPAVVQDRLSRPRPALAGMALDRPRLMGILNITPDSFSDGGLFLAPEAAETQGRRMAAEGADLIDIGGESTRPGAEDVPVAEELARTAPVISALRGLGLPLSIDTRKAVVAEAALAAGASIVNDVAALGFDPQLAGVVARAGVPVILMHSQGTPATMQDDPRYDDVVMDVFDVLSARIAVTEAAGIPRDRIVVDPGIGFGKTVAHNLTLLRGLSVLHDLGCAILLGASRKGFIGKVGGTTRAQDRVAGSIAVALAATAQGVQILRVHDVAETRQALALWRATTSGDER